MSPSPQKKSEEPDELQKVGDFISGPFILPFVIAIVPRLLCFSSSWVVFVFFRVWILKGRIRYTRVYAVKSVDFFEKKQVQRKKHYQSWTSLEYLHKNTLSWTKLCYQGELSF